mgnify:CR=1 FL=1
MCWLGTKIIAKCAVAATGHVNELTTYDKVTSTSLYQLFFFHFSFVSTCRWLEVWVLLFSSLELFHESSRKSSQKAMEQKNLDDSWNDSRLAKQWHTDLEPSPSWYEWKMKEKQLINASWSDFVICSIHVNVTSKQQQQHMCAERAMGFGRQQRLNAADTDKYSHFEEAKCTFIYPTIYNIISWFAGTNDSLTKSLMIQVSFFS